MGLLEKLFPKKYRTPIQVERWEPLTAYRATFTSWRGEIYEFDQVRSAIDALARNTAKLKIDMLGTAKGKMRTKLRIKPNPYQTWYQFWYRTRTIFEMQNNAIIIPILDFYNIRPKKVDDDENLFIDKKNIDLLRRFICTFTLYFHFGHQYFCQCNEFCRS